jgi:hypothetical protein
LHSGGLTLPRGLFNVEGRGLAQVGAPAFSLVDTR